MLITIYQSNFVIFGKDLLENENFSSCTVSLKFVSVVEDGLINHD